MTKYYVSYAIHKPGEPGPDGSGNARTADEFPDFDTLVAVKNTSRLRTAHLRITFFDESGRTVPWGLDGTAPEPGKNYELKPNHSFAMTLIRPNPASA